MPNKRFEMSAIDPFYVGAPMADEKCLCLIPDENDNCTECGKHIDMPDVGEPNLGDIVGIIRLIDDTVKSYSELVTRNTDPVTGLPKMRLVGGLLMRVPHKMLYRDLVEPSYKAAKQLGYRGTMERWGEVLQEAVERPSFSCF